jgi:signal transduction histidine kinase
MMYNEQRYPVGQAITLDELDRTIVLEPHEAHYTLYVNDTPLLDLVSTSPLRGQTTAGPVDAAHTEVMTTSTIFGTQSELYFFFSAPGDPIILPGEPFFDTPAKLAMMQEVIQTNEARINQQLTDSIDGATLTAYAPIRDDQGEPVGLMVVDIHDTQVRAFQWSVIQAFGIGFLIMLLIAVYGVQRIAHYISRPLEQLSAGVDLVSHGNFGVPVVIDKDDEFGRLARDFNTMAQTIAGQHQALRQQQQTLQQRNMELERALAENARLYTNLEHLVQERTARLQTALEEVQATKAQIEQWMHARSDAVRAVVHDLNHTVQGIQSALDVWLLELQEHPLEAAVIESGQDRLETALVQQRTLLQEMRDAALLESGSLMLQPAATDFGALVRQVAIQLQPRYDLGDCTLTVTIADDLPAAWCDPRRIQRVIYNVLENAFRYTTAVRDDGAVQVCVTHAGDELVCTVQDNGRGIAPSDLARLGQKFARLGRGEGDPEGMGLGLNFAIGIMRLSQGTLTLTSPGEAQGTTVTLRLPRAHQSPLLALEYLPDRHTTSETKE